MRNGTTLFLLAVPLLAFAACPPAPGAAPAALEPTDSGAPSAIVIFPVGAKPNPKAAAMTPVAFNHVVHEQWMAKAGKDCTVCHHTGDAVACTTCHTQEGKAEGGFVTLEKAMHATKIAPRKENTPASCVSCHEAQLARRECAGCHTTLVRNVRNEAWCAVCHTMTKSMTAADMQQGIAGTLPERRNEALATETELARAHADYWPATLAPYKVVIDSLVGKYEPCVFNHKSHVLSLMGRIKDNKLAGAFHTEPATLCVTCHHNSPPSATPPKCASCHSKTIDPAAPQRPALKAAFHLQCMSCHKDMKVARPRNTDCTTCHKLRAPERAANQAN